MNLGSNVAAKQSEKKMEGEDGLKTLECLRGRLLAERGASRAANQEVEKMGNKLVELEKQLRKEMKSRNRAEKRLKSLIKKLESMNISYVFSDESSEQSSSLEKSEFSSSVSSSSSSSSSTSSSSSNPKRPQDVKEQQPLNTQIITNPPKCEIDEPLKEKESTLSEIPKHNVSESEKTISEKSNDSQFTQNIDDPKRDNHRSKSSIEDTEETNGENYQDWDERSSVDNSMALVPVDIPVTTQIITVDPPPIANASVKDVLDTLRDLKERIQSSMETSHMISVGFR